jgi:general secretion pathway protein J
MFNNGLPLKKFEMSGKNRGFTLIEILIALMIFAIMGVLAATSLRAMIHSHEVLKKADKKTAELMMTMTLLRRDISQAIDRSVINTDGQLMPSFVTMGDTLAFTRGGLANPFNQQQQSDMQRIGYTLKAGNLVRVTWDVLDAAPTSVPVEAVLLHGVTSLQWQMIASDGKKSLVWPMPKKPNSVTTPDQPPVAPLPTVVLMVMQVKGLGVLQGIFPVPSQGVYERTMGIQTTA